MRVAVIVNRGGGSIGDGFDEARVGDAFRKAGLDAHIRFVSGAEVEAAARAALDDGADVVVAGGGDGTLSTVAGVLAHTGVPMGVLALGTANHFARDLGLPLDLDEAARRIATGTPHALDVAEVNDRRFINNSSLGFYPEVVRVREGLRKRLRLHKYPATFLAAVGVFPRLPVLRVAIQTDAHAFTCDTPFVFIGNNAYEMNFFRFGARDRFQSGRLFLYLTPRASRRSFLRLLGTAFLRDVSRDRDFASFSVADVRIDADRTPLRVFLDGELATLKPPLHYRTHPHALRVVL